jgi:hypothetical protein
MTDMVVTILIIHQYSYYHKLTNSYANSLKSLVFYSLLHSQQVGDTNVVAMIIIANDTEVNVSSHNKLD